MKKHQFLLLVMTCLFSLTMYAVNEQQNNASGTTIKLEGQLRTGGLRSGTDPIVAELQGNMLSIRFQKDVGVLQVTVTGPQGEVYATAVNTEMPSVLSVPFAGLPSGNYTVTFSGERGMMWGEFEM